MGSSETVKARLIVRGRVQGVGFRRFVFKQAQNFPISGWVRNNIDGSVEIEAIGAPMVIADFCREVAKGSFLARVDEIAEVGRETCHNVPIGQFVIRS